MSSGPHPGPHPGPLHGPGGRLERARTLLREAERVLVLTGAGISAESGVPTFRDAMDGLWSRYRPEELATPRAFSRDPLLVWRWYAWRRGLLRQCAPNPAHLALARWIREAPERRVLYTQNVDGLHHHALEVVAGDDPVGGEARPRTLHGDIFTVRCARCDWRSRHTDPIDVDHLDSLPHCPRCNALTRPAVVWFGEALDETVLRGALEAARRASLCLVVGTSALVQPAASLPRIALGAGAAVVEVNPEPTPLSLDATIHIAGLAGAVVPELLDPHRPSADAR